MTRGEGVVRPEAAGSVGIIRIDNPPVNGLGFATRAAAADPGSIRVSSRPDGGTARP